MHQQTPTFTAGITTPLRGTFREKADDLELQNLEQAKEIVQLHRRLKRFQNLENKLNSEMEKWSRAAEMIPEFERLEEAY